jgi:hypothetical protein
MKHLRKKKKLNSHKQEFVQILFVLGENLLPRFRSNDLIFRVVYGKAF